MSATYSTTFVAHLQSHEHPSDDLIEWRWNFVAGEYLACEHVYDTGPGCRPHAITWIPQWTGSEA